MTYKVLVVPRAGVEPARVAPLVFETSASTDSAIWACVAQLCSSRSEEVYELLGVLLPAYGP